ETHVYIGKELRPLSTELKIKLPLTEQKLKALPFKPKFVGLAMSASMQGKYQVELIYEPEQTTFWASDEAMDAYKAVTPYHLIIQVKEEDWKTTEEQGEVSREVTYMFPEQFVRKGEIRLADDQKPGVAVFKVTRAKQE
ncbi:MAG: hypothetical protein KAS23_02345, partial [Anaerohalosphaera sp.]|nr:hypothetical protein [Anaerohalosphaera sp.]